MSNNFVLIQGRWAFAIFLGCLVLVAAPVAQADEATRRTQEELRKRNLYFGEVDGLTNPELINALKKYQTRKGFSASGVIDEETANSLHIPYTVEAKSTAAPWPDVPVLKSDAAREKPEPETVALETNSEPSPEPSAPAESPPPEPQIAPAELEKFVQAYLRDAESDDIEAQLKYYDFPVDYFDHGRRDREFVARDTRNYVKRWPKRSYTLLGPIKVLGPKGPGLTLIEFSISFSVSDSKHAVHGKTRNRWTLKSPDNLRIKALEEQRLRE